MNAGIVNLAALGVGSVVDASDDDGEYDHTYLTAFATVA